MPRIISTSGGVQGTTDPEQIPIEEENNHPKASVPIDRLTVESGWNDRGERTWQQLLMEAADTAMLRVPSRSSSLARYDRETSVEELLRYVDSPTPVRLKRRSNGVEVNEPVLFLTSKRLYELATALDQVSGQVSKLPSLPRWMKPAIDMLSRDMGKADASQIPGADILSYAMDFHCGERKTSQVILVTQQRLSQLLYRVSTKTHENNSLDVFEQLSDYELQFNSMNIRWDLETKTFTSVSTVLDWFDLHLQSSLRPEEFRARFPHLSKSPDAYSGPLRLKKTEQTSADGFDIFRVTDSKGKAVPGFENEEFFGPGLRERRSYFPLKMKDGSWVRNPAGQIQLATFDKGHAQANLQFTNVSDMAESFAMENMHAQVPTSNSTVWLNHVEKAIREEIKDNPGMRAVDFTGVLFAKTQPLPGVAVDPWKLDSRHEDPSQFRPLPANERISISGGEENVSVEEVPVPTHTYKVVLFQKPGVPVELVCKCFIVKNDMNLDSKSKPLELTLEQMEKILADVGSPKKFFQDLPGSISRQIRQGERVASGEDFIALVNQNSDIA